jgi:inorganic pyrophosphatase
MDAMLRTEDWLGVEVDVVVDRPLGSSHPSGSGMVYPINYGFVPDTTAPDGDELDAYVLGPTEPLERCKGQVVAIVRRRDDAEDKLVVRVGDVPVTQAAVEAQTSFQERWFDSYVEM